MQDTYFFKFKQALLLNKGIYSLHKLIDLIN